MSKRLCQLPAAVTGFLAAAAVHFNDMRCKCQSQTCNSGHASDKAASLTSCAGIAAAALCTSSKQCPVASCSKAQCHSSSSLQQISVHCTFSRSAQVTSTIPALQLLEMFCSLCDIASAISSCIHCGWPHAEMQLMHTSPVSICL